jgi:serine/threonine-protein kinase
MDPAAGTELNLADCYERAGQLASAWATFKAGGADARRSGRPQWVVIADKHAESLEPLVPRLVVTLAPQETPEGVAIEIDGESIAPDALGSRIPLDPGGHRLVAKANGRIPFELSVSLRPGSTETVEVPLLAPLPPPTLEGARPPTTAPTETTATTTTTDWKRVAGITVAGAGVLGLGLGTYFGLDAMVKNAKAAGECPTSKCTSQDPVDLTNEAKSSRTKAIIAFSAGGALCVAGAALLVLSARPVRVTPTALIERDGFRVGVHGSF